MTEAALGRVGRRVEEGEMKHDEELLLLLLLLLLLILLLLRGAIVNRTYGIYIKTYLVYI